MRMGDTPRRALLAAVGAVSGAGALIGTTTAQQDGSVTTRGCSDQALRPGDWATGAVTAYACPGSGGGIIAVEATGDVGGDRSQPPVGPPAVNWEVPEGQRRTIWFTGTLTSLRCSDDALNVGVVNR